MEGKEVEEKEGEEGKSEVQKKQFVEKRRQIGIASYLAAKLEKQKEKKGRKSLKNATGRLFFLMLMAQYWLCQCCSRRIAAKDRDDGKVADSGSARERE